MKTFTAKLSIGSKSKKGALAFDWLYFIIFLLAIGVLFIILNDVIVNYIYPIPGNMMDPANPHTIDIINSNNDWMQYWRAVPIFVFVLFLIWIFIRSTLSSSNSGDYGL